MKLVEIAANLVSTASIVLAARNSVHTWWTGIVGCALFIVVFFGARLYADATLQVFFIGSSAVGWWLWAKGDRGAALPIRRTPPIVLASMGLAALVVGAAYGALLHRFTNAYAPFLDSAVLVLSVVAQLLLMRRLLETWVFWIAVDLIAVPLYSVRGLYLTALLYFAYLVNAAYGLWRWRQAVAREARVSLA